MNVAVAKIYEMVNLISKFELTHEEDKYVLAESLKNFSENSGTDDASSCRRMLVLIRR